MGGCKCSYQGCTVKSDGKTHFFHFPVFDKVRCHQWLTNARKLDFLNLKVSQLKNRVVCDHHFKNEMFMNELHDKLRRDAVPTEDGPFNSAKISEQQAYPAECPIRVDDIEELVLQDPSDKKAVFSHKYGDFLTNYDIMDTLNISYNSKTANETEVINNNYEIVNVAVVDDKVNKNLKTEDESQEQKYLIESVVNIQNIIKSKNDPEKHIYHIETANKNNPIYLTKTKKKNEIEPKILKRVLRSKNAEELNKARNELVIPGRTKDSKFFGESIENKPVYEVPVCPDAFSLSVEQNPSSNNQILQTNSKPKSKIKILSEENINYQPSLSNLHLTEVPITCLITNNIPIYQNNTINQDSQTIFINSNETNDIIRQNEKPENSLTPKNMINTVPKSVIEKKRRFNMKLRDVIKTSIDRMDDTLVVPPPPPAVNENPVQVPQDNVITHLSAEPNLPNLDQYNMSFLEARITKMENLLINKINYNSNKIIELKNLLYSTLDSNKQKDDEAEKEKNPVYRKKKLYQEISEFLSPEVNSMIYEQLFLEKYDKMNKMKESSKIDRRKRKKTKKLSN